MTKSNLC